MSDVALIFNRDRLQCCTQNLRADSKSRRDRVKRVVS